GGQRHQRTVYGRGERRLLVCAALHARGHTAGGPGRGEPTDSPGTAVGDLGGWPGRRDGLGRGVVPGGGRAGTAGRGGLRDGAGRGQQRSRAQGDEGREGSRQTHAFSFGEVSKVGAT